MRSSPCHPTKQNQCCQRHPQQEGEGLLPPQPEPQNFRRDFRGGFSSMTQTATKPHTDYQRFEAYHRRGYEDAIAGKPQAQHFVDLVRERGYLSGWAMGQLTPKRGHYWNHSEYWRVWLDGVDDELHDRPYENPYPLKSWKHLAYLSGVRSCQYCYAN